MEPPPPPPHHCTTTTTAQLTATSLPTPQCFKCGAPTNLPSPPPPPDSSSPPAYIPIRLPAVNLPPNTAAKTQQSIVLTPVPQPHPVPPLSPPFHFTTPIKRITSPSDASHFIDSFSGKSFLSFVAFLSHSIRGHKISDPCPVSDTLFKIISVFDALSFWVDEIPPALQSARYGNPAFRVWHQRMTENSQKFMLDILQQSDQPEIRDSVIELVPYWLDSFGNASRIDYGTGHETNFAAWLFCLARLGLIHEEDYQAVVSRVFVKYLDLMRKLQLVYCLEPAGSHGVWGLDDYHFLPFVFGSAQLIDHKYMKPKSIHNDDILENFSKEYLYLSCIAFIKKVKKGPFAEHSPMLDDISGVPNWNKVNSGMLKMYRAEVLEKVPIVQHFLFGSIIPWE
ncbi:serine/threonine-protein phosphatase 2A activator-like [Chenopodium quinoa]|uniref:serine/threonine-protein phosphatase 2A activator-like n=1 Tax=Chenopodium quinoa TaxID=63459 RepID=UPI000B770568|nr:serine/threonine-protein phosphatase 2A activator-like [Chenopodium quinoa]